jgi:hypothetical protein
MPGVNYFKVRLYKYVIEVISSFIYNLHTIITISNVEVLTFQTVCCAKYVCAGALCSV